MAKQPDISDEAVQKATGRAWPAWFELLDAAGGKRYKLTWRHTEYIKFLSVRDTASQAVPGNWQKVLVPTPTALRANG